MGLRGVADMEGIRCADDCVSGIMGSHRPAGADGLLDDDTEKGGESIKKQPRLEKAEAVFYIKKGIGLFPFDYFIIPIVKCIMFIIRTLTISLGILF